MEFVSGFIVGAIIGMIVGRLEVERVAPLFWTPDDTGRGDASGETLPPPSPTNG